jgi:hypothetical protein
MIERVRAWPPGSLILFTLLGLAACAAPPVRDAPGLLPPADPCAGKQGTMWVVDGVAAALADQRRSLCTCFRPDEEGARIYLEVLLTTDGKATARSLGYAQTQSGETDCWVARVQAATANWLALKPGWYADEEWTEAGPVTHQWAGLLCEPGTEELPIGPPQLSQTWLTVNPQGVVFPAELPDPACFESLRRNVRITFPVELIRSTKDKPNRFDKAK